LHRALHRLSLPAAESSAVVLDDELHGAFGHRKKNSGFVAWWVSGFWPRISADH
jgi:hypothetical protein